MNAEEPRGSWDGMAGMLSYNPVWWWIIIFIILAIIMITTFYLVNLKTTDEQAPARNNVKYRNPALFAGEIDKVFLMVSNRAIPIDDACQRVSLILREYLEIRTGMPALNMSLTELQKVQAPPRVVGNIKYLYPIVFGDRKIATYDEFLQFMNSSRAVIDGKWD